MKHPCLTLAVVMAASLMLTSCDNLDNLFGPSPLAPGHCPATPEAIATCEAYYADLLQYLSAANLAASLDARAIAADALSTPKPPISCPATLDEAYFCSLAARRAKAPVPRIEPRETLPVGDCGPNPYGCNTRMNNLDPRYGFSDKLTSAKKSCISATARGAGRRRSRSGQWVGPCVEYERRLEKQAMVCPRTIALAYACSMKQAQGLPPFE